jgi:hypothetical protein
MREASDELVRLAEAVQRVYAMANEFHTMSKLLPSVGGEANLRLLCLGFARRIDEALAGPERMKS